MNLHETPVEDDSAFGRLVSAVDEINRVANKALAGDSNDAEHDALVEIEGLSDFSSPNPDGEGGYAERTRTVAISEQVADYLSELIEYQMDHGSGIEDPDDQAAFDALVQFRADYLLN